MANTHKEEIQEALQVLYDAAKRANEITDDDDYDEWPDILDEAANVVSGMYGLVDEDGKVRL